MFRNKGRVIENNIKSNHVQYDVFFFSLSLSPHKFYTITFNVYIRAVTNRSRVLFRREQLVLNNNNNLGIQDACVRCGACKVLKCSVHLNYTALAVALKKNFKTTRFKQRRGTALVFEKKHQSKFNTPPPYFCCSILYNSVNQI